MSSQPQLHLTTHQLLVECARAKLGVLSRRDLSACGLSRQAVGRWLRAGKLQEVFPGAFVLAGPPLSSKQLLMSALVWAGNGARLSHRSAAALIGLDGYAEGAIELTMPSKRKPPERILVHHLEQMSPYDSTMVGPLTTSTPARIILDLGAVSPIDSVECAVEDVLRRKLSSLAALRWELRTQGGQGVPGSATMRKLLEDRPDGYVPTDSRLELRIDRVLRSLVLPPYVRQLVIETRLGHKRPDFAFPAYRLAVEGDSYAHHSGRRAWERDNQRDRALRAAGWDILYVTWEDVHKRRDQFIRDVYAGLERNGWSEARLLLE
jgi:very-short-patch-repair endonuclease